MPEYITLRDAIEFCGPRVIAGWRGNGLERHAPSRSELIAERSKVLEMSAEAILADAKATQRNRKRRLEREHALADQALTSVDGALDKLRTEIALTKARHRKAQLKRALAELEKSRSAKPITRSKDDFVNDHRDYLLDELEKAQAPAIAARERWDTIHHRLRRVVRVGALQAYARLPVDSSPLGIIVPLAADLFPEPAELHVALPLGVSGERFRSKVVFVQADLEQVFNVMPKSPGGAGPVKMENPDQKATSRDNVLLKARNIADDSIADCKRERLVPKMTSKRDDCFQRRASLEGITNSVILKSVWAELRARGDVQSGRGNRSRSTS